MKAFLKSTLIATALATTLQAVKNIIYYTPLQESINAWMKESLVFYGISTLVFGLFGYTCFLLLGFAISSNRGQLPTLSPCMRKQAIIITILMACRLIWYITLHSIGSKDMPQIYSQIAGYATTAQSILIAIWLWQLAFSNQDTFHSETLGKVGKTASWVIIGVSISWIVAIIKFTAIYEGDIPRFLYSIMTYVFLTIYIVLLTTYCRIARKQNIINDLK